LRLLGLLCVAAATLGWRGLRRPAAAQAREYVVTRKEVAFTVRQRGVLASAESAPCIVMTHGYIQEIVEQGTPAKKGDLVFRMDDTFAREEFERRQDSIQKEELTLEILRARRELVKYEEERNLAVQEAELVHARLEESEELGKPTEEELRLHSIEREIAVLGLEDAEEELRRRERLYRKNFISLSALAPYQRKAENAGALVKEIDLKIEVSKKGIPEERRIELRTAVERAEAVGRRAEKRMARRLAEIEKEMAASEKRILENRHHSARARQETEQAEVRAARDGVVKIRKYRDWRGGGRLREYKAGVEKWPQDIIADVIDPEKMKIKLVVNESDFHVLREGMPVRVCMPAFPGRTFRGRLEQLGAIGHDRSKVDPTARSGEQSEIMMFSAEISFDGGGTTFQPGMSAMVEIMVEDPAPRLVVPREAVHGVEGGFFVNRKAAASVERVEVKGRILNERYFLVEGGLKETDVVLLNCGEGT